METTWTDDSNDRRIRDHRACQEDTFKPADEVSVVDPETRDGRIVLGGDDLEACEKERSAWSLPFCSHRNAPLYFMNSFRRSTMV